MATVQSDKTSTGIERLEQLDVLRGLAALSVLCYHLFALSPVVVSSEWTVLSRLIGTYGGFGVPLFYALSGFSLYLGFFAQRGRPDFLSRFYVRRLFRIAPLFYFVLGVWIAIILARGASVDMGKLVSTITFTFNFVPGYHDSYVAAGWSVGVEMLFYAAFPILLVFAFNLRRAICLFVVSLFVAVVSYAKLKEGVGGEYAGMSVVSHLPYFCAGVVAYFIRERLRAVRSPGWGVWMGGALLIITAVLVAILTNAALYGFQFFHSTAVQRVSWAFPILSLLAGVGLAGGWLGRIKALVAIGHWSFGIYLLHPIVIFVCAEIVKSEWFGLSVMSTPFLGFFASVVVCVLVLAWISFRWLEAPFIELGRYLTAGVSAVSRSSEPGRNAPPTGQCNHVQLLSARLATTVMLLLVSVCALFHVYQATRGWHFTLLGHHGFRQGQTALSTAQFVESGFKLQYETPVFGPPWSIPMEFPVYQAVVAACVKVLGVELEPTGRAVSLVCFYGCLGAVWFLLRNYAVSLNTRLAAVSLLLVSPVYIFWSRAFLIESTALLFSLWYGAVMLWEPTKQGHTRRRAVALVLGCIAALAKVTTFALSVGFVVLALGYLFWLSRPHWRTWIWTAVLIGGPLAVGVAWAGFGDSVKRSQGTPMAAVLLAENLTTFYYGTVAQRLSEVYRTHFYYHGVYNVIGSAFPLIWLGLSVFTKGALRVLILASIAAYLGGPLVFANLYFVHDYYWYANAVFLLLAIALSAGVLFQRSGLAAVGGSVLVALMAASMAAGYQRNAYSSYQRNEETYVRDLGAKVASLTDSKDMVMIVGFDWDSSLAYYSGRRAIMPWVQGFESHQATIGAVRRAAEEGMPLRLLIVGGADRGNPGHVAALQELYGFATIPMSSDGRTDIYERALRTADELRTIGVNVVGFNAALSVQRVYDSTGTGSWLFHAPSTLVLAVGTDVGQFSCRYGMDHRSYSGANSNTDGASFTVTSVSVEGVETQLWTRRLQPSKDVNDAGFHQLTIPIPSDSARLILRTDDGEGNGNWDWTTWSDLSFLPLRKLSK